MSLDLYPYKFVIENNYLLTVLVATRKRQKNKKGQQIKRYFLPKQKVNI